MTSKSKKTKTADEAFDAGEAARSLHEHAERHAADDRAVASRVDTFRSQLGDVLPDEAAKAADEVAELARAEAERAPKWHLDRAECVYRHELTGETLPLQVVSAEMKAGESFEDACVRVAQERSVPA